MKKIIVAVDSFKGSMTSLEAGNAIRNGIKDIHPDWNITVYPVADGGDGTYLHGNGSPWRPCGGIVFMV